MINKLLYNRVFHYLVRNTSKSTTGTRKLAAKLGISRDKLSQILQKMRDDGLLDIHPRSGIKLEPESFRQSGEKQDSAAQRVRKKILQEIKSGLYPINSALPKINILSKELQSSDHTIRDALKLLLTENYLHREGRRFIVAQNFQSPLLEAHKIQTILVFQPHAQSWEFLHASFRTGKFCQSFVELVDTHSIYLKFISCEEMHGKSMTEKQLVEQAFSEVQLNVLGSLIIGYDSNRDKVDKMTEALSYMHKPIVWFNSILGPDTKHFHRLLTYCHFDEKNAMNTALRFLEDHGHHNIAYIQVQNDIWQETRGTLLKETAKENYPKLTVNIHKFIQDEYTYTPNLEITRRLDLIQTQGSPLVQSAYQQLFSNVANLNRKYHLGLDLNRNNSDIRYALLAAIYQWNITNKKPLEAPEWHWSAPVMSWLPLQPILESKATAIIAPSDLMAKNFIISWLKDIGYLIPKDISIISFDCRYIPLSIPLSSVDFGFGYLGEQAFKTIFKKPTLIRVRNRKIGSHAHTVDRGSVGWVSTNSVT